jgi:hypothetical protein
MKKRPAHALILTEKALDQLMLNILQTAMRHQKDWIDMGQEPDSLKAVRMLAERGSIEIDETSSRYRLK